jgi:hypothetical protein
MRTFLQLLNECNRLGDRKKSTCERRSATINAALRRMSWNFIVGWF